MARITIAPRQDRWRTASTRSLMLVFPPSRSCRATVRLGSALRSRTSGVRVEGHDRACDDESQLRQDRVRALDVAWLVLLWLSSRSSSWSSGRGERQAPINAVENGPWSRGRRCVCGETDEIEPC